VKSETAVVTLPYGSGFVDVTVPRPNLLSVASPREAQVCEDAATLVRNALKTPIGCPPFSTMLAGGEKILLLVDDITRPTPVSTILPVLLDELRVEEKGLEVKILIALGTHRKMTREEMESRVGAGVFASYPVLNHDWEDERALIDLGRTPNGTPIKVNRLAEESDLCMGIGTILPHNLAGWSGGAKILQPGICGKETTYGTHLLAARCPTSNLGKAVNPVRREIEEVASRTKLKGIVNAILDRHGNLVHVVAGESRAAHRRGIDLARSIWQVPVPALADIVIVSSYPADIDFWQANKGLYAAEKVVKKGGDIILVTPCPEGLSGQEEHVETLRALQGIPSRSLYHEARRRGIKDYAALTVSDIAARCMELGWVTVVSEGLSTDDVAVLGFGRAEQLAQAVTNALTRQGEEASIVILPHGGECLPVIQDSATRPEDTS
jgi:nickel-dependent lactate racemase